MRRTAKGNRLPQNLQPEGQGIVLSVVAENEGDSQRQGIGVRECD